MVAQLGKLVLPKPIGSDIKPAEDTNYITQDRAVGQK